MASSTTKIELYIINGFYLLDEDLIQLKQGSYLSSFPNMDVLDWLLAQSQSFKG